MSSSYKPLAVPPCCSHNIYTMNVITNTNKQFTRVEDVVIPSIYNRRFKVGVEGLDAVFGGQGFLPGMVFTIAGGPGGGKSTILLQTLELVERAGKKTAFISSEENVEQVAFACKRLGVKKPAVANMTCIEDIFDAVEANVFDIIILDSFPALTCREKLRGIKREEFVCNYIVQKAKELEVVVGIVLHFTKSGTYKGGTLVPHSVDENIILTRNKEDSSLRDISVTKNRFGPSFEGSFYFTETGFNFDVVEQEVEESSSKGKKTKGASRKDAIIEAIKNGQNTLVDIIKATEESAQNIQFALRDLTLEGSIEKNGRGQQAIFSIK